MRALREIEMVRRFGIVLSVLWLIAFPVWAYKSDSDGMSDRYGFRLRMCHSADDQLRQSPQWEQHEKRITECEKEAQRDFYNELDNRTSFKLLVAISGGLLAVFWGLGWLVIGTGRWIFSGSWRPTVR